MEKRFLLALVLSLTVLLGYQYILQRFYGTTPPPSPAQKHEPEFILPPPPLPEKPRRTTLFTSQRMVFVIDEESASISAIKTKNISGSERTEVDLVKIPDYDKNIGYMWLESPKLNNIKWIKVEDLPQKVSFSAETPDLRFKKSFLSGGTPFDLIVEIEVTNISAQITPLYYGLVGSSSLTVSEGDRQFFDVLVLSNGKIRKQDPHKIPRSPTEQRDQPALWIAMRNKYFSLVAKPEQRTSGYAVQSSPQTGKIYLSFLSLPVELGPNQSLQERFIVYAGPTSLSELSKLGGWAEETVYFGWFGGISKLLLKTLVGLKRLTGSYGVSIILTTALISLCFLPLSLKSYKAMSKMKLLQPEMDKLRELYKDKPQKLNKEVMELYRKHKANPLGGCLPLVFQMPIFIAFYQVLMRSFELRGASFLFIRDLSLPDGAIRLPFSVWPIGGALNILPILMIGAMLVQQKLTGTLSTPGAGPEAEAQKMMTKVMPLMFGFIFYGLPSGLVLYWLTNTLLSVGTQRFFIKT